MTTTHHHQAADGVADLGSARKKRLEDLLVRRDSLAVLWAEEQSHLLPRADDLAHELGVVEQAIGHCYPWVYERDFSAWVARDASLLHSSDSPSTTCRLCTASWHAPDAA